MKIAITAVRAGMIGTRNDEPVGTYVSDPTEQSDGTVAIVWRYPSGRREVLRFESTEIVEVA